MKRLPIVYAALVAMMFIASADAQDLPAASTVTKQHQFLKMFAGQWNVKSEGVMAEGQPAVPMSGKIDSQLLGDFWVVNRMKSEVAGMSFSGIQTVGFDSKKNKYVGTWIDTTADFMWKYEGFVDESGKKLILEATGPDMMNPAETRLYRDAYEFKDKNTIITTSSAQKDDGTWMTFMNGTATRVTKDTATSKQ